MHINARLNKPIVAHIPSRRPYDQHEVVSGTPLSQNPQEEVVLPEYGKTAKATFPLPQFQPHSPCQKQGN